VKLEDRATTKVINYVRANKLTYFYVTSFSELGLTPRQAKSAIECLVDSGRLFHLGLESSERRARVIYGSTNTLTNADRQRIDGAIREAKIIVTDKLDGWRDVFPAMFNPVQLSGTKTVYKQAMV